MQRFADFSRASSLNPWPKRGARRQSKTAPEGRWAQTQREGLLELLGVDDLSSSGQRRQRRAVGRILEVQLENLPLELKEVAFGFGG